MPSLFFKFLSLRNQEHLERVGDIIKNHHIYWPTKYELNDPMEGSFTRVRLAYAGVSIADAVEPENPYLIEMRKQYRILSLSESCFVPQLWAYYADNYSGICLCYYANGKFASAEKVEYKSSDERSCCDEDEYTDKRIRSDFMIKEQGWQHEKEWRIVEKSESEYFDYDRADLAAVIFGPTIYKMHDWKAFCEKSIMQCLPENLPVFRVYIRTAGLQLCLLENDAFIPTDGSQPPFIYNADELYNRIRAKQ